MLREIKFNQNTLLLPSSENIDTEVGEISMFFVQKGETLEREYIFEEIFEGEYDYLTVVLLPDFDPTDKELLNETIDYYEDNPEEFTENMYEIARTYH